MDQDVSLSVRRVPPASPEVVLTTASAACDGLTRAALHGATGELCRRDADLAGVVERYGPPPLWARPPGFATLARIILEQQVSLASARAIIMRVRNGLGRVTAERVASTPAAQLRRLGLTRQKADYLANLARLIVDGDLDLRVVHAADDTRARDMLVAIRGIGPWTADIYLLMALRRPDVWPTGDLALATAMQRVKRLRGLPVADRQRRVASAWRPWRSVAARILWHSYLSERKHDFR